MPNSMGQIIKTLRKQCGLTQEELAEKIGVTSQAVSKWENDAGLPDISQIVPLASVFHVKTDVLFGLDPEGAEAAIAKTKALVNLPETDNERAIALWSELLALYPQNDKIRFQLAKVYTSRNQKGDYERAIALYEKILDESTDSGLRLRVYGMLCFSYNRIGDMKTAVRIAKLCGPSHLSADCLLAKIDGYEHRKEANQRMLSFTVNEAAWCLLRQTYKSDADTIFAYRTALALLDLVYYDGNKTKIGYVYITLHTELSKLFAKTGDDASLYEELERWLDDIIFDDSQPIGDRGYPNHIFLDTVIHRIDRKKEYGWGLDVMRQHLAFPEFDRVRNTERFQAFLAHAEEQYRNAVG